MAQYRELLAFAQFGSDLDKSTKARLDRGARIMEVLKQGQYSPYPVEEQVISFFAVTKGHFDSISLENVARFERELLDNFRKNTTILGEILEKKALDKDLEERITESISEFKANFN